MQAPIDTPARESTRPRPILDRAVVLLLFLLSGFSALVYQLIWTQQFALFFGATASATTAVLASYMFGLGLGAALIGRWIHRIRRPTLWYAIFEAGIAVAALGVGPALGWARWGRGVGAGLLWDDGGNIAFYVVASFLVLALPTTLMGATLPLLVRFWVRSRQQISRGVASLYMANTFGAALGTLTTGFVLIPRLGLGQTLGVAVAINVAVALLALAWFRGQASLGDEVDLQEEPATTETVGEERPAAIMFALICGSGLVGMAYEVYWTRVLTHALGGSLYAFAMMLSSFLIGLSLGSLVIVVRRWNAAASWAGFGLAQFGVAASGLIAIHGLDGFLAERMASATGPSFETLSLVAITLVPIALLLGASFPLAVRAVAPSRAGEARYGAALASAKVYAWNTLGTIIGSIACGFYFLPRLQFDGTAQLLTIISLCLSVTALTVARGPWRAGAVVGVLAILAVSLWPPPTPWELLGKSVLAGPFDAQRVSYLGVGHSATVMVQDVYGEQRLTTDGLPESAIEPPGSRPARYAVAHWLGLAPASARPEAEKALVVGFGAGITAQALPAHIRRIDVAEIEPEVIEANRLFSDTRRQDPLADPRLNIIIDDARSLLVTRPERYDLVISQPSHPWTLGAASLFTSELYEVAASRLTEKGIFTQWIGLRFVDTKLLRSQVATLLEHFAYVEVLRPPPTGAAMLLASQSPIELENGLRARWPELAANWREAGVESPGGVVLGRWLDAEGSVRFAQDAEVSKDSHNLLMIHAPWVLTHEEKDTYDAIVPLDAVRRWQGSRQDLYPLRRLLHFQQMDRARAALEGIGDPELRAVGQALWDQARGNEGQGRRSLERYLVDPSKHGIKARGEALAALLVAASNRATGVPSTLVEAVREIPELSLVHRAWQRLRLGDWQGAAQLDPELSKIDPEHPIYVMAIRMRVLWRQNSGLPENAREAIALIEPQLSTTAGPQALMLRVRLAMAAEDDDTLFATLLELGGQADRRNIEPWPNLRNLVGELAKEPKIREDARWATFLDLMSLETDRL